jgi:hypothetical protein
MGSVAGENSSSLFLLGKMDRGPTNDVVLQRELPLNQDISSF